MNDTIDTSAALTLLREVATEAVAVLDREGRVMGLSPTMEELLGVRSPSATHRRITTFLPRSEARTLEEQRTHTLSQGVQTSWETELVRERGERRLMEATQKPWQLGSGQIAGTVITLRDVLAQREKAEAVDLERRFERLANTAPVLLWMSDTEGMCTFFNQSWLAFTGRSLEEERGVGWAEGVHHEDLQRCLDTFFENFSARRTFVMEYRLKRHDGEYRYILDKGGPRHDVDGRFLGFIGSCIDITDRREAELALRASEERMRGLVRAASDAIVVVDDANTMVAFNPAATRIFGYAEEEALGQPLSLIVEDTDAENGDSVPREGVGKHRAGQRFPIEASVGPPTDGLCTWILRDVSERRALERQILETVERAQRQIGQDLHDGLGQLLTGVAMLAKGIGGNLPDGQAERGERLVQLVNEAISQVRVLSRGLSPLHVERLSLPALMRQLATDTKELLGISCEIVSDVEVEVNEPEARSHLYFIAREALTNAARHGHAERVEIHLTRSDNRYELSVRDNGQGMPPQSIHEGIGISSMRYRARILGGFLEIVPAKPQGTVVRCVW